MPVAVPRKKEERLVARVSKTDKRLLEKAAAIEGRSLASFVVRHALETAEDVIKRQNLIRLNEEQSARFVEALLEPSPRPTAAFKKAAREYKRRVGRF